jgi:hypothetical protein
VSDEPIVDEYLWDGSGEGDPELRELERLLARFRHRQPLRLAADEQGAGEESED